MTTEKPSQPPRSSHTDDHSGLSQSEYTELEPVYLTLRKQGNTLILIKQINRLISGIQRHRGMSMSLLAGGETFRNEINELQHQLQRRIAALDIIARNTGDLLSDSDKENLNNAWTTIRDNWQQDHLVDNFELHSHFIEQLLAIVGTLSQRLIESLSEWQTNADDINSNNATYPRSFKQIEVVNFVADQTPTMIELIAKIRGLSSHATTVGTVEYSQDRKLRYLIECARKQNEKLRHQSERLKTLTDKYMPALTNIKTFEMKLLHLFDLVERDVLGGTTMKTKSQQLFELASEIISAYDTIINQGWDLIRHWLELDVESWITQKPDN